jgi:hypothetical protein
MSEPDAPVHGTHGTHGRHRIAVLLLTVFFVAVGLRGVDYGDQHWDEPSNVKQLAWALQERVPFPRWYYYPSGLMMVLAVAALPEVVTHGLDGAPAALMELPYRLRARGLLILLTALAIPLTFVLARRARCSPYAALFAAALVATSFQLQTHARFIAPNGILVPAAVLCSILLAARDKRGLLLAALIGGVAAGVKYSAGIVAVPLVVAALQLGGSARERAWRVVVTGTASLLGFLVTTPGALFEPGFLARGLEFQRVVYGDGWVGYTVDGPFAMATAMAGYGAFALLSPFALVACALACLAVVGATRIVRDRAMWTAMGTAWLFPVLYAAMFLGQHVFADRNFLPLLPFGAVLAALGAEQMVRMLAARTRWAAWGVGALVGAAVVVNAAHSVYAANTIPDRSSDRFVRELSAFVTSHRDEEFLASPGVRAALAGVARPQGTRAAGPLAHENLVAAPTARTKRVLAYPGELLREWMWPCTDPFLVERVFGPLEVEWRYAPTWRGVPRVVMLDIDKARAIGASLSFTPAEGPGNPRMPMEILGR